jgi:hypothetical protein
MEAGLEALRREAERHSDAGDHPAAAVAWFRVAEAAQEEYGRDDPRRAAAFGRMARFLLLIDEELRLGPGFSGLGGRTGASGGRGFRDDGDGEGRDYGIGCFVPELFMILKAPSLAEEIWNRETSARCFVSEGSWRGAFDDPGLISRRGEAGDAGPLQSLALRRCRAAAHVLAGEPGTAAGILREVLRGRERDPGPGRVEEAEERELLARALKLARDPGAAKASREAKAARLALPAPPREGEEDRLTLASGCRAAGDPGLAREAAGRLLVMIRASCGLVSAWPHLECVALGREGREGPEGPEGL